MNKKYIVIVVSILLCVMVFPVSTFAADLPVRKVPGISPARPMDKPLVPKSDGQITNVTAVPAGVWRTGTTVRVQWTWPGYVNFPADVILGTGSKASFQPKTTIITNWGSSSAGWVVPYTFALGTYTVRVQSSKNNKNFAEMTVRIEDSSLSLVSPKAGQPLIAGTTNQIMWSFQGKPGPLRIDLISASGGIIQVASGIPWGTSGNGSFTWPIAGNLVAGNYQLRLTSTASSAITSTGPFFPIVSPSITLLQPVAGTTFQQGAIVPITWSYKGDIGPNVKLKIWKVPDDRISLPFETQTPTGASGQGGYNGWKPNLSASFQQYLIRVESLQKSQIFSQITAPISVPGSSSVHGAAVAPKPNAKLVLADVTFFTTSDNKDHDSCIDVYLKNNATAPGSKEYLIVAQRERTYCGSDSSTEFKENTSITLPLDIRITMAPRRDFDKIRMAVRMRANGSDTWKFKVKVVLRFDDGSTMIKQSIGESSITDYEDIYEHGTTITDWQELPTGS